jgi:hypothetical protein
MKILRKIKPAPDKIMAGELYANFPETKKKSPIKLFLAGMILIIVLSAT